MSSVKIWQTQYQKSNSNIQFSLKVISNVNVLTVIIKTKLEKYDYSVEKVKMYEINKKTDIKTNSLRQVMRIKHVTKLLNTHESFENM